MIPDDIRRKLTSLTDAIDKDDKATSKKIALDLAADVLNNINRIAGALEAIAQNLNPD